MVEWTKSSKAMIVMHHGATMAFDNQVRIIGGRFKSKHIEVLNMEGLRPTTERARETIFNWLNGKIEGTRVLDLFAGSGALGLEALSRGAHEVIFVENNRANAKLLQNVVESLGNLDGDSAQVKEMDALAFLKNFQRADVNDNSGFDLIFLDPPFSSNLLEESVELLVSNNLLNEGGLVYVEMGKAKKKSLFGLEMLREGSIGVSHFGLYQKSFFL